MFTLKQKILAAAFKFMQAKLALVGMEHTVCEELPRLTTIAEATAQAPESLLCDDSYDKEMILKNHKLACWKGESERLSWMLYTLSELEGGLKKHIHEGKCKWDECDPVFKMLPSGEKIFVRHRARTLWQLHKTNFLTKQDWSDIVGTSLESTLLAAQIAGKEISWFKEICGTEKGALSIYATGKTCKWSEAPGRVNKIDSNMKNYSDDENIISIYKEIGSCFEDYDLNGEFYFSKMEKMNEIKLL
jgi:hypothetical protein